MNRAYWLLAVAIVPALLFFQDEGPTGTAVVTPTKKPKKPKPPPGEDTALDKTLDNWSRPVKTERDQFRKVLDKEYPSEDTPPREGSEAEYAAWFDRLSEGKAVWRETDITRKPARTLFRRLASALEVDTGEITREQFLRFARSHLEPGQSPPWDDKPPKDPASEAVKVFRKLDRNRDGLLDEDEMPANLRRDLSRWDRNLDARISAEEYQPYFQARLSALARERGITVPEGVADVQPSSPQPEHTWKVYRPGQLPGTVPRWFSTLDTDGDGQVGLYEWKSAGRDIEEYLRLDLNRDGFVTVEELLRSLRAAVRSTTSQSR